MADNARVLVIAFVAFLALGYVRDLAIHSASTAEAAARAAEAAHAAAASSDVDAVPHTSAKADPVPPMAGHQATPSPTGVGEEGDIDFDDVDGFLEEEEQEEEEYRSAAHARSPPADDEEEDDAFITSEEDKDFDYYDDATEAPGGRTFGAPSSHQHGTFGDVDAPSMRHNILVQFCVQWSYRRNFEELRAWLSREFPELRGSIRGERYPAWRPYEMLASAVGYLQIGSIILMLGGGFIFRQLGMAEPSWYKWMTEHRMMTFGIVFVANTITNRLVSTGAFEITMNGLPVFSKLQTGTLPDLRQLADKLTQMGLEPPRSF